MNLAASGGGGGSILPLLLIVGLFALTYFMIIRPQNKRRREAMEMQTSLAEGVDVVTIGGAYGTVVELDDETVLLEVDEDVTIRFARPAIARVLPSDAAVDQPAEIDDADDAADVAAETDETASSDRDASVPAADTSTSTANKADKS